MPPALEVWSLNHWTTRESPLVVLEATKLAVICHSTHRKLRAPSCAHLAPACHLVTGVSRGSAQHLPVWSLNVSVSDYRAFSAFQDSAPSLPKASSTSSYPVGTEQMLVKCK